MNFFKRIQYNAPVTLTYALLCLAVLGVSALTEGRSGVLLFGVYRSPITDPLTYVRLVGHVLGHINFQHYFANFSMILLIGPILEEKYGSLQILGLMGITTLVTGLLHIALFPDVVLMGASGIAFMLIILSSFVNLQKGRIPMTLLLIAAIFIGDEIIDAVTKTDQISNLTHIIGGVCGAALGFAINRRKFAEAVPKAEEESVAVAEDASEDAPEEKGKPEAVPAYEE